MSWLVYWEKEHKAGPTDYYYRSGVQGMEQPGNRIHFQERRHYIVNSWSTYMLGITFFIALLWIYKNQTAVGFEEELTYHSDTLTGQMYTRDIGLTHL